MEKKVITQTGSHIVKEANNLDEASLDWLTKIPVIGALFDKEQEADATQGEGEVSPSDINSVNIPVPYPEDQKKDILKNPEVKKLLAKFNYSMGIDKYAHDFAKVLVKYPEQVDEIIAQYTALSDVENTYSSNKLKDSPTEVSVQNELIPKLASISKRDKSKVQALKNLVGKKILKINARVDISKDHMVDLLRIKNFSEEEVEELLSTMGSKKIVKEQLSIANLAETDVAELISEINKFYPYAKEYLGFDRPVELTLISDPNNAKDTFGKTAYYSPANEQMTIFVDGRHPKDIIRSFSHELVHHAQNCRGEFDRDFNVGENYIETDDHLREMEREAYDKGNMCLRTYESYLKKENKTMNEQTLRKAIREAIKRVVENKTTEEAVEETNCGASKRDYMEEDTVTEDSGEEEAWHQWKNEHADDDHIKEIEHHLRALRGDRDHERDEAEYDHDKYEDEGMEEGADQNTGMSGVGGDDDDDTYMGRFKKDAIKEDEAYVADKDQDEVEDGHRTGEKAFTTKKGMKKKTTNEETTTPLNESLAVKKGQIVFDKLVKKWCK